MMKFCYRCGKEMGDDDAVCPECGYVMDPSRANDPAAVPSGQDGGEQKKGVSPTTLLIVGMVIVMLGAMFLIPAINSANTETYEISITVTDVSVKDPDNGFALCKDSDGRVQLYLNTAINGKNSVDNTFKIGKCKADATGSEMIDSSAKIFKVSGSKNDIKITFHLLVLTDVVDGKACFDDVDLFDVTGEIESGTAPADPVYGATGVIIDLSEFGDSPKIIKGDSNPLGTMTIKVDVKKV